MKEVMKLVWWQDLEMQYLSSIYFNNGNETAEVQKPLALDALQQNTKLVLYTGIYFMNQTLLLM